MKMVVKASLVVKVGYPNGISKLMNRINGVQMVNLLRIKVLNMPMKTGHFSAMIIGNSMSSCHCHWLKLIITQVKVVKCRGSQSKMNLIKNPISGYLWNHHKRKSQITMELVDLILRTKIISVGLMFLQSMVNCHHVINLIASIWMSSCLIL